jgi:lipopolysaccharide export system permease protein
MKFSRYLVWNFVKTLLLLMFSLIIIFVVIDFMGNIRQWLTRETKEAVDYYWNYLPYIVYLVSPVALLISVIVSIGGMARHLEMTAIQSSGRSPLLTLMPVFWVALFLAAASWWLSETILPDANHRRFEIMQTSQQQKKNARVKYKADFVFIDSDRVSWFLKHYSGVTKSGRDVLILIRNNGELEERFDAKGIRWEEPKNKEGYWVLENGYHRRFAEDGTILVRSFESEIMGRRIRTQPEDLINERQTGDEMDSKMISRRIEVLKRSGEDTKVLETAFHFKYAGPWMNFIIVLIGASLCHRFSRSGGLSQKFGVGVLLVFIYYIVIRVGLKMGENGALTPFLGAWIGHFIFGTVAIIMLYRSFRL